MKKHFVLLGLTCASWNRSLLLLTKSHPGITSIPVANFQTHTHTPTLLNYAIQSLLKLLMWHLTCMWLWSVIDQNDHLLILSFIMYQEIRLRGKWGSHLSWDSIISCNIDTFILLSCNITLLYSLIPPACCVMSGNVLSSMLDVYAVIEIQFIGYT